MTTPTPAPGSPPPSTWAHRVAEKCGPWKRVPAEGPAVKWVLQGMCPDCGAPGGIDTFVPPSRVLGPRGAGAVHQGDLVPAASVIIACIGDRDSARAPCGAAGPVHLPSGETGSATEGAPQ